MAARLIDVDVVLSQVEDCLFVEGTLLPALAVCPAAADRRQAGTGCLNRPVTTETVANLSPFLSRFALQIAAVLSQFASQNAAACLV